MSFVDGFYSFNVELADSVKHVYLNLRQKLCKHPNETYEHLVCRMLAFCHAYKSDLKFSEGLYDLQQPAIWSHNLTGEIIDWIEIGTSNPKRIKKALKSADNIIFYFYDVDQIHSFTYNLRGSTTNWIENIQFYLIDADILTKASEELKSSNNWSLTILDETILLLVNNQEIMGAINKLDMWDQYQKTIFNH